MICIYYTAFDISEMTRGQVRSAESVTGKNMLRHVLLKYHGMKEPLPEIEISSSGKPYLADRSYEYNLTHSNGVVVLAVSDEPIGIDIEKTGRVIQQKIFETYLHLQNGTVADWTKFESYCKLSGGGIYSVSYPPKESGVFFRIYTEDIPGYTVCVCSKKDRFPENILYIDPKDL